MLDITRHARRLAEQRLHRHINGMVVEQTIADDQLFFTGGRTDHGERTALALTQSREAFQILWRDGQHITLLRFVAPEFGGAHTRVFALDRAQFEAGTNTPRMRQFGHRVRQATGTDIVHRENRVVRAHLPATIDDFLGATFDLGVAALHRGEIQIGLVAARGHRRGGAAPQANEHARATQLHEQRARLEAFLFEGLSSLDRPDTAGDHDRLVIATNDIANRLFVGPEITRQIRPAEFVVECSGADRAFDHDVERAGDAIRLAGRALPWLLGVGQIQVRHGETTETGFGLRAFPGSAFVTDLAARTSGRPWKRRNGRRVIMRFHLSQIVRQLIAKSISAVSTRIETFDFGAFHDRGVIRVGHDGALRRLVVRIADHAEQCLGFGHAIDDPVGVKDLVTAVLGVGLRKHHQLHVGRVAAGFAEDVQEIFDFVVGQCQTHVAIGGFQRRAATQEDIHGG